ncbi:YhdT family protein [Crassaminicella profunda]|uniref:YhdT family protein n=1 Tax=Crassaminicella profunda TaxID=1286698 RepID=UPI001CA79C20|nr:YhdT family protein [Crassaminicella profunda]QZY57259.1 YhdT family protein [Crassaminicella profunda]
MDDHKKEGFIEDPRYKQCNKEALMGIGLGILNLIWWYVFGYGLGSKAPEDYTYIMGLPMWFFMSCIVGAVLFSSLAIIMVSKFFKDMPLDKIDLEDEDNI